MPKSALASFIMRRPWLNRWAVPFAEWYADAAGYRKLGLRYDDLLMEENDIVQLALKRLPPKEAYDRLFRIRRAFQCSLSHQLLPKDQQTPPEEDYPYLTRVIEEIEQEIQERDDLDAMKVTKKKPQGQASNH